MAEQQGIGYAKTVAEAMNLKLDMDNPADREKLRRAILEVYGSFTSFALSETKPTPKDTAADNSTLASLLKREGFGVVKLKQANLDRDPKRLVIDVEINRVSASFEVDTGAGGITVAQGSLKKFRLIERKTSQRVPTLGKKPDPKKFWGIAKLDTFAIGNWVFHGVPVAIKEIPHCDGFLGSPEMHRVGAVLDCAEPALYLARRGPSSR